MNAPPGRQKIAEGPMLRIAMTAYHLVKDAEPDDQYGAYWREYGGGSIRVRYAGRVDVVLTQGLRIDIWYRGWGSRRSKRAAAFMLDHDRSVRVILLDKRSLSEWTHELEARLARTMSAQR